MTSKNISELDDNFGQITSQIKAIADRAYQRGWADAIAAVQSATSKFQVNGIHQPTKNSPIRQSTNVSAIDVGLRPSSLIESVYKYIKANPGQTTTDALDRMEMKIAHFNKLSARTAIKRLRQKGLVKMEESKLY